MTLVPRLVPWYFSRHSISRSSVLPSSSSLQWGQRSGWVNLLTCAVPQQPAGTVELHGLAQCDGAELLPSQLAPLQQSARSQLEVLAPGDRLVDQRGLAGLGLRARSVAWVPMRTVSTNHGRMGGGCMNVGVDCSPRPSPPTHLDVPGSAANLDCVCAGEGVRFRSGLGSGLPPHLALSPLATRLCRRPQTASRRPHPR
jgi:hypothetical protein